MEDRKAKVRGAKKIADAVTADRGSMEKASQAKRETLTRAAKAGKETIGKASKLAKAATLAKENAEKVAEVAKAAKAAIVAEDNAEKAANAAKTERETVGKAAKVGQETVEKTGVTGKESPEKAAGADALSTGYDRYLAPTGEQLERVLPEAGGKFGDFTDFGRGAADAIFKAGDVVAKALESIGDDVVAYNRQFWQDSIDNTKALLGCQSFEDVVELQTTVARAHFEKFVHDSAKLGERSLKTLNQALEPIGG